ncbi:MAG TPA: hypothetical protein VFW86_05155, partial [Candidatus Limnocylindrales bacterium]|nr:hypothetical protein [Candidatus Limnocylindrales bacterium]
HAPWDTIVTASAWVFSRPDGVEAVNVAVLLLFIGLFLYGLRRLPVMYSLYVLPQLALVSMRLQPTPLTSTTRYMLVLFPGFVALALLTRDRPRLHEAWLVISILGLGLLTTLFLQGDFVA